MRYYGPLFFGNDLGDDLSPMGNMAKIRVSNTRDVVIYKIQFFCVNKILYSDKNNQVFLVTTSRVFGTRVFVLFPNDDKPLPRNRAP